MEGQRSNSKHICVIFIALLSSVVGQYNATWESLDSRPLPTWFDEDKIGIFLHWGAYSVPSFNGEWFWAYWRGGSSGIKEFMDNNYPPNFTYADFASQFSVEFYNPDEWADIFKSSGARYVVLTSKHHEGFTMWPSTYSFNWNAKDVGANRDLLGDLADSVRNAGLRFGAYYSLYEWYNPMYLLDKKNNFTTQYFVDQKMIPEMMELVNQYKTDIFWVDGDWEADDTYFRSREFLVWLYNESPVKDSVVVNDRWGIGIPCKHGGYFSCADRYNPGVLQGHKWEGAMTVDKSSWGFRREAKLSDYLTIEELIEVLVETVTCGGNLLVNVGPSKEGRIIPIFEERLRQMGQWLEVNGEAIYKTKPWTYQNDTLTPGVWYSTVTDSSKVVYALVLDWPSGGNLRLQVPVAAGNTTITMLGYDSPLQWTSSNLGMQVVFPEMADISSKWAWVLRMTDIQN